MNKTIELKNHSIEKRTFKQGAKEVIQDLSFIKTERALFLKLFSVLFLVSAFLTPLFITFGFGFITSFFTSLVFPALAIASFQKTNKQIDNSIAKETFSKLFQFRIYIMIFSLLLITAISLLIPLQIIMNDIGLTQQELQTVLPAFLETNGSVESFNLFSEDPLAQKFLNGLANLNMGVFWACWAFGGISVILVTVNGFLALMQIFTLPYIGAWDSLKMAMAFNFKNGGYFIGKTLGILAFIIPISIFSGILGEFFKSMLLLYTVFVFYKMIDGTVEEKEIK